MLCVRSGAPYMNINRMNWTDVADRLIKHTVGSVISSNASASFIILRVSLIKLARNSDRADLSRVNATASACLATWRHYFYRSVSIWLSISYEFHDLSGWSVDVQMCSGESSRSSSWTTFYFPVRSSSLAYFPIMKRCLMFPEAGMSSSCRIICSCLIIWHQ